MTLKDYVRARLEAGRTAEEAWRDAEAARWHAPWNYVRKIARDWKQEREKK